MRPCLFVNKDRRGFTLTEAAIVLGVAGIILGAIWAAASAVYDKNKIGSAQKHYLLIAQNVRSANGYKKSFSGTPWHAITTAMITAKAIPPELVTSPTKAINEWGGDIAVYANVTSFRVAYYGVPKSACIPLITSIVDGDTTSGAFGVTLNSGGINYIVTTSIDADIASGASLCDSATDPTSVEFDFHL